jgi:glycosyltransferase involved in cell wall biosynthesis
MISVVTPSFRQLDWLRLAMASVADQQGVEIEHIIQDGGTEDIGRFFEEHTARSAHAQLFVERDEGMYDAINRGLHRANGDICAYLNCDEQYLPGALQRVVHLFRQKPEIDVMFGDALVVAADGEPLAYRRVILPTRRHIAASHLNVFSCAMFFRRRVIEAGHLLDPTWRSIGDAIWIDGMLRAGIRMTAVSELLSVFTLTGQNLSSNPVSDEEKARWAALSGSPARFTRLGQIFAHRLRKLQAGAYRRRSIAYEIYTLKSPSVRMRFNASRLGGTWPTDRT